MSGLLQSGAAVDPVVPGAIVRPATMGEVWDANRVLARGDRTDAEAERLRREYEPLLSEVNADRAKRGLKPMVNPGYWQGALERRPSADNGPFDFLSLGDTRITRDQQQQAIFSEIAAIRRRNPKFLSGVPQDLPTFSKGIIDREKAARAGARSDLARSSGIAQGAVGFAGGVWETMHDTVNIASLPLGGGGNTIWAQAGRSVLLNGGLELIQQPIVADNREQLGEELTLGEAGLNTLMGAAGGVVGDVVIPQLGKAAAKGIGMAIDAATPMDRKIAAAIARADLDGVSDADLAATFGRHVSPDLRTPDESAAIHVIERDAEIRASSPYVETPEGMDAHAARMRATMEALVRTNTPDAAPVRVSWPTPGRARLRTSGGRLANDVVSFFREKGYSEAQARGIAAGVAAEAASNHMARNPTSGAMGLGQWLGPRKAALIERFGPNPTRRQQLEFLHSELQGGDRGGAAVLRATDEASALRAYIHDFMRPAKGAETSGDLSRGMAALGRESEDIAAGADLDIELDAPIARSPDLDAERVSIDAPGRVDAATDLPQVDYADLPQLRRDLFDDEGSWAAAQQDLVDATVSRESSSTTGDERGDINRQPGPVDREDALARLGERLRLIEEVSPLPLGRRDQMLDLANRVLENELHRRGLIGADPEVIARALADDPAHITNMAPLAEEVALIADRPALAREAGLFREPVSNAELTREVERLAAERGPFPLPNELELRQRIVDRRAATQQAARDAIAGGRLGATPVMSPDAPRQLDLFAEPHGEGAKLQADSLVHDMRAAIEAEAAGADLSFRLDDGTETKLSDILADIDEDEALIATVRGCL
jgi:hypothetical protein